VATDDERIAEICLGFGADVIMTSESCRNGKSKGATLFCFIYFHNLRGLESLC
jgi:CMP-2-keto-3-deoxyoctulosonic acid synthetase